MSAFTIGVLMAIYAVVAVAVAGVATWELSDPHREPDINCYMIGSIFGALWPGLAVTMAFMGVGWLGFKLVEKIQAKCAS